MYKRIVLCAGVALLALSAQADYITSNGNDSVRLTEKPCALDIPQKEAMPAALAIVGGTEWRGCWASAGRTIHLVYEDGDIGQVPITSFRKAPEA